MRVVGYVWAAPTVLMGLVFLLPMWGARQIRPHRWKDGVWEWLIVPGSLFWRRYSMRGWAATTLGWCVFYTPGCEAKPDIARHERRHVWQALWLGPLFFPVYGALWLAFGYRRHPMERDARDWERRVSA